MHTEEHEAMKKSPGLPIGDDDTEPEPGDVDYVHPDAVSGFGDYEYYEYYSYDDETMEDGAGRKKRSLSVRNKSKYHHGKNKGAVSTLTLEPTFEGLL